VNALSVKTGKQESYIVLDEPAKENLERICFAHGVYSKTRLLIAKRNEKEKEERKKRKKKKETEEQ